MLTSLSLASLTPSLVVASLLFPDWDEQVPLLREMKGYQWVVKELDTTVATADKAVREYEERVREIMDKVRREEEVGEGNKGGEGGKGGEEGKEGEGKEDNSGLPQPPALHLLPAHSNLFVVTLIYRRSPKSYNVNSTYYISQGVVYKCPRLDEVIRGGVGRVGRYLGMVVREVEEVWSRRGKRGRRARGTEDVRTPRVKVRRGGARVQLI